MWKSQALESWVTSGRSIDKVETRGDKRKVGLYQSARKNLDLFKAVSGNFVRTCILSFSVVVITIHQSMNDKSTNLTQRINERLVFLTI